MQEVVIELRDRSGGFAEIEAGAVADVGRLGALRAMRGVGHECEYIHLLRRWQGRVGIGTPRNSTRSRRSLDQDLGGSPLLAQPPK